MFVKRTCTTSKPEIPELAKREAKLIFQHQIADLVEKHDIPHSMIMNFDQTRCKFAPVQNRTLDKKGSSHIAIVGSAYKQAIIATFGITFANSFLPMQLSTEEKPRSIPHFRFPKGFSLSANPKHFSNTQETLKLMDEIMIPYVESECKRLQLNDDHPALVILDVFSGQRPVLYLKS